jgi:Arylsulfotransferase (ASST)
MLRILFFIVSICPFFLAANAQYLPKEGSGLNYRIIGFSVPEFKPGACTLEIAEGDIYDIDSFRFRIIKQVAVSNGKAIIEVPRFGEKYTWMVTNADNNDAHSKVLHRFSTLPFPDSSTRLHILKHSDKYTDGFVFVDGNCALYDMKGNAVWFPNMKIDGLKPESIRNLRNTPKNTITFLSGTAAFEINYNSEVVWKPPNNGKVSGDGICYYHHQLTRFDNGHYMILGNEPALCKLPSVNDTNLHVLKYDQATYEKGSGAYKKIHLGTVIEYDEQGNVVWSWKSSDYFIGSDIEYYRNTMAYDNNGIDVHENAFYFDEAERVIYVSFKKLNRILKISYPEGKVIAVYGDKYDKNGQKLNKQSLFCAQHFCFPLHNGNLLIYNNNSCHAGSTPQIIEFKEQQGLADNLEKVWEYNCDHNDGVVPDNFVFSWESGGNIRTLSDNSIFACLGGNYSKLLIIGKNKGVQWSALPETFSKKEKKWLPATGYRAYFLGGRKELEQLIWNADNK